MAVSHAGVVYANVETCQRFHGARGADRWAGPESFRGRPVRFSCILLLLVAVIVSAGAAPRRPTAPLVRVLEVDPTLVVDLSYRRADNVFRKRFYSSNVALLRRPVAERLARANARLRRLGFRIKIWDAYRPHSVQKRMWRLTPSKRFLVNPRFGSHHSRGAAVDVTLVDLTGRPVPMPTPHDEFSRRARRGALQGVSRAARANWRRLDKAMRAVGFRPLVREWWHFDDPHARRYALADIPLPRE
ncbi:MAG: M15 family metallopeptidase [Armatimonadetes bacterium]|nr:M15 family metallopeptidase [Armatimonadota bacterium]